MKRVAVFVDGFNLFYSVKAAKAKWLDIASLVDSLLRPGEQVVQIHYFTAMVDGVGDTLRPNRQQVYIRALKANSKVRVHLGSFLNKTVNRPVERLGIPNNSLHLPAQQIAIPEGIHSVIDNSGNSRQLAVYNLADAVKIPTHPTVFAKVYTREEKGSDVNLAAQMLHRAWKNEYDHAIVISNDSDLCEPIKLVKTELDKKVTVCYVAPTKQGGTVSSRLRNVASSVLHVKWSDLLKHQFPDPLITPEGKSLTKPTAW
ncbi:MAG: NYN domain-containing protein [bacterium]|nr:NYN domain-containing protein [bacterium]